MDDFIVWMIIIILAVVLSRSFQKPRKITEASRKKAQSLTIKICIFTLFVISLILVGFILILFGETVWGVILAGVGILYAIGFYSDFKKWGKELKELNNKQEQEGVYEEELIKERAKLQAKKEFNQRKRK